MLHVSDHLAQKQLPFPMVVTYEQKTPLLYQYHLLGFVQFVVQVNLKQLNDSKVCATENKNWRCIILYKMNMYCQHYVSVGRTVRYLLSVLKVTNLNPTQCIVMLGRVLVCITYFGTLLCCIIGKIGKISYCQHSYVRTLYSLCTNRAQHKSVMIM